MTNFMDYVRERGIEIPEHTISGAWFAEHGYPIVVRCSCCGMTMATPSAYIDEEGYTFCSDCAGVDEE